MEDFVNKISFFVLGAYQFRQAFLFSKVDLHLHMRRYTFENNNAKLKVHSEVEQWLVMRTAYWISKLILWHIGCNVLLMTL